MIELEKKLCIVSIDTLQELFEYGADPVALYMFYYKQCKMQKTNQSWTTDAFAMKGLQWGRKRLTVAKKVLKDKGLVKKIVTRKDGKIAGHYIKLSYIWGEEKSSKVYQKQQVDEATSCGQPTNALSVKKEMLKVNKQKQKGENVDFEEIRKLYPHARKAKKKETKEHYNSCEYSFEEIHDEIKLLRRKIVTGKQDGQYLPAMERWMRDFVPTNEAVKKQFLKQTMIDIQGTVKRDEFDSDRGKEVLKPIRDEMQKEERQKTIKSLVGK